MKEKNIRAKDITGYGSGGVRMKLIDHLPLKTPLAIDLFPVYACNFRCNYCIYAIPFDKRGLSYNTNIMPLKTLEKVVNDSTEFREKIKMFRFVGNGEPLLHPEIDKMVSYVRKNNIADKIEIITNGSMLTHEMSDRLIESGLTQIRISLQGVCSKDYKNNSNVDIDFNKFVENIRYLYEHKDNLHVNLKIADIAIDSEEKKEKFFDIFGSIADSIAVEKISPVASRVDYTQYGFKKEKLINIRGVELSKDIHICNHPFYLMLINPDGSVYPCCTFEAPPSMGNINEKKITDIWNGKEFNRFRKNMLKGVECASNVCKHCKAYLYNMFEEDIITDEDAEKLILKY